MVKIVLKKKDNEKPIKGVWVYLSNKRDWSQSNTTDDKGIAEFTIPEDDDYQIKVHVIEYRPYIKKVYLSRYSIHTILLERSY